MTDGDRGAYWRGPGSSAASAPAEPVEVVDTTGAGDAFKVGYLRARLDGGAPSDALEAGCRLAATIVARAGAL